MIAKLKKKILNKNFWSLLAAVVAPTAVILGLAESKAAQLSLLITGLGGLLVYMIPANGKEEKKNAAEEREELKND